MRYFDRASILPIYLLSLSILLCGCLFALDPQRRITQYDLRLFHSEHGLPMNSFRTVFQGREGYIWAGCQEGLVRYDGVEFRLYTRDAYPGLSSNFIEDICEDSSGNLWLATQGGGACRFDGERFVAYDTSDGLASNIVNKVLGARDGSLWFGTDNGITRLKDGEFRSFRVDDRSAHPVIVSLWEDPEGQILFGGAPPGLHYMRDDSVHTIALGDDPLITAFGERSSGGTLLGTATGELYHFDQGQVSRPAIVALPLPYPIRAISEDENGNIWLCSEGGGIARYAGGGWQVLGVENGLPGDNNFFLSMAEDREGGLWLASEGGLYHMIDNKFRAFGSPEGFVNNNGASVCQDRDGYMWAGLRDGGVARFTDTQTRNYGTEHGLLSAEVEAVCPDPGGGVWIGSTGGLNFIRNGEIRSFRRQDGLPENHIVALCGRRAGGLWIGTQSGFLVKYDGRRFTAYRPLPGETASVIAILEEANGDLWIGTRNAGLVKFTTTGFRRFRAHDGISAKGINAFYQDAAGRLWIATDDEGLYVYQDGRFVNFSARDGLSFDRIYSVLEDRQGGMWFHGNRGIFRVEKQALLELAAGKRDTLESRWFSALDGMRETECNGRRQPTAWQSRDGRLWFASIAGVVSVDPGNMPLNLRPPPVYLEKVITPRQHLARRDFPELLRLDPHEQNLEFHYTALSFAVPERVRFKYMLEGYDPGWIEAGARRSAYYTNLSHGNYTFRVTACNNDGIWNEAGVALNIRIAPHWWQTGWAYTGYALGVFLALWGMMLIFRRQAEQQARLRNRAEQAGKLAELDRMKTRFFANISHEFRTPLTLILGPLEQFLSGRVAGDPQGIYRLMHRNARRLLALINQLLDLSRLEAGHMQLQARPENLDAFLKPLVMSFTSLADQRRILLEYRSPEADLEVYVDPDKLYKIVTNLISNAFKFTPEGGIIIIAWEVPGGVGKGGIASGNSPLVEISVQDSGPGIPADKQARIFDRFYQLDDSQTRRQEGSGIGLALVKELVEVHKGSIDLESEPGKGSRFIVRLPLGKAHLREDELAQPGGPSVGSDLENEIEAGSAAMPLLPAAASPPDEDSRPLVLIVEDNPDLRLYIRSQLAQEYRVLESPNGTAGVEQAQQALPDLVISDVMMPEMDGFELCRRLKRDEKTSHIPVILLTALATLEHRLEGLDTRADDYVLKPFNPEELLARSRNLIELRRLLRERYRRELNLPPQALGLARRDEAFLDKAIGIIEAHIDDNSFGVMALAAELGWARETVYRKIRALTDLSVEKFIYDRRLRRAAQLLQESDATVTEITYATGFSSPGHLARHFRQQYDMAPSEYRRQHKKPPTH